MERGGLSMVECGVESIEEGELSAESESGVGLSVELSMELTE